MSVEQLNGQPGLVFWPDPDPEEGIGEPAILIRRYSDVLSFDQGNNCINVNLNAVPEFLNSIKAVMKLPEPK